MSRTVSQRLASGGLWPLCMAVWTVGAFAQSPLPEGAIKLIQPEQFPGTTWVAYVGGKEQPLADTWRLETSNEADASPVIVCSGEPYGYLRTVMQYENFEFGAQWRYPSDENGNSGILLFTSGEDRLWPDALQVQLHHSTAGSTFPSGEGKSKNELRNVPALSRPIGEWNDCRILSVNGRVTVVINGKRVGEVTGYTPQIGTIGLQSEGSAVHFREIWIREIDGTESADMRSSQLPRRRTAPHSSDTLLRRFFLNRHSNQCFGNSSKRSEFNVAFGHHRR